MLVWHYAEHPAFDCELAARQPLTVEKRDGDGASADAPSASAPADRADDRDVGVVRADD